MQGSLRVQPFPRPLNRCRISTPPPLHTGQLSLKGAQEVGLDIPIHLLPPSKGPLTKVSSTASRIPGAEHCFCQI